MRDRTVLLTYACGPIAAVALIWLARIHVVADTPYLVLLAVLCSTSALNGLARMVSSRLSPGWRLHLRLAVAAASTAAVIYAVGWGSLLGIAFAVGVADVLRTEGSAAWRPGLLWSAAAIAAGEGAIIVGLAPSLVSGAAGHAIAVSGFACLGIVLNTLGASARDAESCRESILREREYFRDLVQHATDVIAFVDEDGDVGYISPAVKEMLGSTPEQCVGRPFTELMGAADRIAYDELCAHLPPLSPTAVELRFHAPGGAPRRIATTVTIRPDGARVVNLHDVTPQRQLEDRLRQQATMDALTGLPNRHGLMDRLQMMRQDGPLTVLFIDLDGFKEVNDELGHERGDGVLVESAARIALTVPADTLVGRLGGDEFLAAHANIDESHSFEIASAIRAALAAPWPQLGGRQIGASVGIAVSAAGESIEDAIRRADGAMYEAKCSDGSRRIVVADPPELPAPRLPAAHDEAEIRLDSQAL